MLVIHLRHYNERQRTHKQSKIIMINMNLFSITFLVLISVLFVCGCKIDVQQSTKMMSRKDKQPVSIPCSCNISSCLGYGPDKLIISWYVFRKDSQYQIDLKDKTKYTLEGHNLKINSLSINDYGVYYCAAALPNVAFKGAQAIGQGITLKVMERGRIGQTLLLTLLVLLIVYSLLVLSIIICIKTGCIKSLFKGRWSKRKTQDHSRQVIFSGVVQELYKRNLVRDKIQVRGKVSQEQAKGPQIQDKNEDIYQNFDE